VWPSPARHTWAALLAVGRRLMVTLTTAFEALALAAAFGFVLAHEVQTAPTHE
jgi:hypothetical protein